MRSMMSATMAERSRRRTCSSHTTAKEAVTSRLTHLLPKGILECYQKGMGEHPDALATVRQRARRCSGNVEAAEGEI
jgi:hypothetical protein